MASFFKRSSSPLYFPVAQDSRPPSPPFIGTSTNKTKQPQRSKRPLLAAICCILAISLFTVWESQRPESKTQELLQHTGLISSKSEMGMMSKPGEMVSVVLVVGENDHGILEVAKSILSTTVGPYELIGVYTEPWDQSQRIINVLMDHHGRSKVDAHGRGLKRYTAINATEFQDSVSPVMRGITKAKSEYIAIINGDTQMMEYGWDRILLNGLKSDSSLLAVSGKSAANINYHSGIIKLSDTLGEPLQKTNEVNANSTHVEIRNVAMRSPIMYDAEKGRRMAWMDPAAEAVGLGDIDMCLEGAGYGYKCGYYPVSTKTREEWKTVPGSLQVAELNGHLSIIMESELLDLLEERLESVKPVKELLVALPRNIDDIPRTIVTAFSGNHQRTVQHWYNSLHHAPHTRFIAYILPSDMPVAPESYSHWKNVEIRNWDFSLWPEWMDVTINRGEYAWKPLIVEAVMKDYGGLVFWLDSGDELTDNFDKTWRQVADMGLFSISVGGPIWLWTHPGMKAYLDIPESLMERNNCNAAMWGINSQHYDAVNKIARPLFDCAKTRECIAPLGSNRSNHRQDQAALGAFIHMSGYGCDAHAPIRMAGDAPGDGSKFCSDGREC